MIKPFPLSSFARLILLPGEFSMSSTSGMASPTLTKARGVEWKRREVASRTKDTRRAANMASKDEDVEDEEGPENS